MRVRPERCCRAQPCRGEVACLAGFQFTAAVAGAVLAPEITVPAAIADCYVQHYYNYTAQDGQTYWGWTGVKELYGDSLTQCGKASRNNAPAGNFNSMGWVF